MGKIICVNLRFLRENENSMLKLEKFLTLFIGIGAVAGGAWYFETRAKIKFYSFKEFAYLCHLKKTTIL